MILDDPYQVARSYHCDEATAAEIAAILDADRSGWRALWLERLQSTEWLNLVPYEVPDYLDPADLRRVVAGRERRLDPNDPDVVRLDEWLAAGRAGSASTIVEIASGQVVGRYPPTPTPRADA